MCSVNLPIQVHRMTKETDIQLTLDWQMGCYGHFSGSCGIGFFDHMLHALCHYGGFEITLQMEADYQIDQHHALEDLGYVLGTALRQLSSTLPPFKRFSDISIPMDDALCHIALDLGARPYYDASYLSFKQTHIGAWEVDTLNEFLRAFSLKGEFCCHIQLIRGQNQHHQVEAIFKALGSCLYEALSPSHRQGASSTKGLVHLTGGV